MKLYELTDEIRVKVHLHNEEKNLLKKLRAGTPKLVKCESIYKKHAL